jgi:hypothetical protein
MSGVFASPLIVGGEILLGLYRCSPQPWSGVLGDRMLADRR